MKRALPFVLIAGIILAGSLVYLTRYVAARYLNSTGQSIVTNCDGNHATHDITIQHNVMLPSFVHATRCDSLRITNTDNRLREIAFGYHNHHIPYNGITENELKQGESFTVVLNQTGTFVLHDHLEDDVQATFSVID